jgi:3-phosphoshikimate 1-carboxyvinyltransferase
VTLARTIPGRPLRGETAAPGDKSITQRAILLGALAPGVTRIAGANPGADAAAVIGIVRALGARVARGRGGEILIHGGTLGESERVLDARNSGTALRLAGGLLAAQPFLSVLTGDASLSRRPVGRVIAPLRLLGADLAARDHDQFPPLVVRGRGLIGADVDTGVASAQVKSAVLLAAIQAVGTTRVTEPAATRDHTERMLPQFGAAVLRESGVVRVAGPAVLHGAEVDVPGDVSAAAFLLAAAALVPRSRIAVRGVGVNPTRTAFLDHLGRAGVRVTRENERTAAGEPVADLLVEAGALRAVRIGPGDAPALIDELPLAAVLAAFARGLSVIRGAAELRVKESDRIRAVAEGLTRIGVRVEELPDGWSIHGTGTVRGGTVDSQGDHRIAMAFLVAGLRAREGVRVRGAEATRVSDPEFLPRLRGLLRP